MLDYPPHKFARSTETILIIRGCSNSIIASVTIGIAIQWTNDITSRLEIYGILVDIIRHTEGRDIRSCRPIIDLNLERYWLVLASDDIVGIIENRPKVDLELILGGNLTIICSPLNLIGIGEEELDILEAIRLNWEDDILHYRLNSSSGVYPIRIIRMQPTGGVEIIIRRAGIVGIEPTISVFGWFVSCGEIGDRSRDFSVGLLTDILIGELEVGGSRDLANLDRENLLGWTRVLRDFTIAVPGTIIKVTGIVIFGYDLICCGFGKVCESKRVAALIVLEVLKSFSDVAFIIELVYGPIYIIIKFFSFLSVNLLLLEEWLILDIIAIARVELVDSFRP